MSTNITAKKSLCDRRDALLPDIQQAMEYEGYFAHRLGDHVRQKSVLSTAEAVAEWHERANELREELGAHQANTRALLETYERLSRLVPVLDLPPSLPAPPPAPAPVVPVHPRIAQRIAAVRAERRAKAAKAKEPEATQ